MAKFIDMSQVRAHYARGTGGRHWFDKDTLRFFGSRIAATAYMTDDGSRAYFVTSEQPPYGPRKYSVRCYSFETREIETEGEFCSIKSNAAATREAKRLAEAESAAPV